MNSSQAKSTLLVRAVELADPAGILLPHAVRDRCTSEAVPPEAGTATDGGPTPAEENFLARRAALLEAEVRRRSPRLASLDVGGGLRRWLGVTLLALALGVGLVAYRISPDQRINLLAMPLLGLIAWNLAMYALLLVRRVAIRRHDGAEPGPLAVLLAQWLTRARMPGPPSPAPGGEDSGKGAVAAQAAGRFMREWVPLQAPLATARARTLLHAGALLLALGAAAGLVFRGLYLEYQAGWESTFLEARTVRALLATILGPASLLTGLPVPEGAAFEALRFRTGFAGGEASNWIWLYVVAAGLYVGVPRALLAIRSGLRERALRRAFYRPDATDRYFHRLLQAQRGTGEVATILWHGLEPDAARRSRVRDALRDEFGGRVTLEFLEPVEYGEEASVLERLTAHDPREHLVTVFSLAATPEEEVQGVLLSQLAGYGPAGEERVPLVLLDAAPLARFAADGGFRAHYEERLRAWKRFVSGHGASHLVLEAAPAGRADT